jgi:hypothetical protein
MVKVKNSSLQRYWQFQNGYPLKRFLPLKEVCCYHPTLFRIPLKQSVAKWQYGRKLSSTQKCLFFIFQLIILLDVRRIALLDVRRINFHKKAIIISNRLRPTIDITE